MAQWQQVVDLLVARKATPFVDLAYQGFGDGLEEDAAATRLIAASLPRGADRRVLLQEFRHLP